MLDIDNIEVKEDACDCGMQKLNEAAYCNNEEENNDIEKPIDLASADVNGLIRWVKTAKLSKKYELMRALLKDPETRYIIFEISENSKYGKR